MNENKRWFAVYTKARWEKKIAETLIRKEFEVYCPINKVVRQWIDRKKILHEPLFASYVFVKTYESQITSLREVHGIINIIYWLERPAIIRDSEIETIKRFLCEHSNIRLEKTSISVHDGIKIVGGPLVDPEGQILSLKNKTVKVILPSLGYIMSAEVETSSSEMSSKNTPIEVEMRYPLHAAK